MKRLGTVFLMLAIGGCGGSTTPQRTQESPAATEERPDVVSSDPAVQYFHEQLIANGEEPQSAFGTQLSTLGMNARDLLLDDPKHAYDLVMEKVRLVEDQALRREMMRAFFNQTDTTPH